MKNSTKIIIMGLVVLAIICVIVVMNNNNTSKNDENTQKTVEQTNNNDGVICEDIKLKLKETNTMEKIVDNFYAVYAENDGLMRIEIYDINQNIEDFYNDDLILEEANAININKNHEYYLEVDEKGIEKTLKPSEVKEQIANNQFKGEARKNVKVDSKESVEINGIKGIKYTISYTEMGAENIKTNYLLDVNGKIYKFNLIVFSNDFEEIIKNITKI